MTFVLQRNTGGVVFQVGRVVWKENSPWFFPELLVYNNAVYRQALEAQHSPSTVRNWIALL
jgi:hypothetical protein